MINGHESTEFSQLYTASMIRLVMMSLGLARDVCQAPDLAVSSCCQELKPELGGWRSRLLDQAPSLVLCRQKRKANMQRISTKPIFDSSKQLLYFIGLMEVCRNQLIHSSSREVKPLESDGNFAFSRGIWLQSVVPHAPPPISRGKRKKNCLVGK